MLLAFYVKKLIEITSWINFRRNNGDDCIFPDDQMPEICFTNNTHKNSRITVATLVHKPF